MKSNQGIETFPDGYLQIIFFAYTIITTTNWKLKFGDEKMTYTLKQFMPLITFVVPSIIISVILFVFIEPPPHWSMILGFVVLLIMASFSYFMGIKGILKEKDAETK